MAGDDILCAGIMLTGMVWDLSTGCKQLAIANNCYDAVCGVRKDVRAKFLHGELVGLGIPLQMYVNGNPCAEIDEFKNLMRALGVPTTLEDVGIQNDGAQWEELIECTYRKTVDDDPELLEQIREGFAVMAAGSMDELKAAMVKKQG